MIISPRHVNINGSVINAGVHFQITLLLKNTRLKNIPTRTQYFRYLLVIKTSIKVY
jgi:hypothetical protein